MDELAWLDATALARLIPTDELSPLEAVDAAIARIETANPKINAVITPLFEQARQRAAAQRSAGGGMPLPRVVGGGL